MRGPPSRPFADTQSPVHRPRNSACISTLASKSAQPCAFPLSASSLSASRFLYPLLMTGRCSSRMDFAVRYGTLSMRAVRSCSFRFPSGQVHVLFPATLWGPTYIIDCCLADLQIHARMRVYRQDTMRGVEGLRPIITNQLTRLWLTTYLNATQHSSGCKGGRRVTNGT